MSEDTLLKLLTSLEQADNALVDFDPEQHRETLLKAEVKIDSYKYILDRYTSRIAEIDADIEQLTAIKKTLQNRSNSLKDLLLWVLKQRGIDSFPGVKHVVKLMERKRISTLSEPDSSLFFKFPDLVKREYSWDKRAFDKAYIKDVETLGQYAKEDKTEYVQFYLNRSIDGE